MTTASPRTPAGRIGLITLALGGLSVLSMPAQAQNATGQAVYERVCVTCHGNGTAGAPKFGDAKAWKPLIAEGQKALVRTAIKGIRQMPPKGGDASLSHEDVERAVVYMANAAGGRFKEPK